MEGREWRHGIRASSKTEDRLVRRRMSDLLFQIGIRSCERRLQPRVLKGKTSSSIRVRRGGTSSERWDSIRLWSVGCQLVSTPGFPGAPSHGIGMAHTRCCEMVQEKTVVA